jgi:hypothetical protein
MSRAATLKFGRAAQPPSELSAGFAGAIELSGGGSEGGQSPPPSFLV